jgi:transposase-like protein
MEILNYCMKNKVQVWTLKEGYKLGDDITCKVLAFAFSLAAELERNLISMRTREALKRKRAEGVRLGRTPGKKSASTVLTGKEEEIRKLISEGLSKDSIAKIFGVHRHTIVRYFQQYGIKKNGIYLLGDTAADIPKQLTSESLIALQKQLKGLADANYSIPTIAKMYNIKKESVHFVLDRDEEHLGYIETEFKKMIALKIPIATMARILEIDFSILGNIFRVLKIKVNYCSYINKSKGELISEQATN